MKLYNTLSRSIEKLEPTSQNQFTFYSCGPTVYDYSHLGHFRTYINIDFLKKSLQWDGFNVKHIMNITDVGHLTGDDDSGEDKLEKGARKQGKSIEEIVEFFTQDFFASMKSINIQEPEIYAPATKHIPEMIALIEKLEEKGYTYNTDEAIYFDTSKDEDYGKLSGQNLEEKIVKSRSDVHTDPQKKHPADFALWFKRVGRFADHTMHWASPWGDGFPGWHIECSAMSMKYLGETIDIHSGGVDHISVHHENEIAQSESATGKQFVKYWFHPEFLMINGEKMSKSKGNLYRMEDVLNRGIDPLALRYLFAQTHYKKVLNFTWESLESADNALYELRHMVSSLKKAPQRPPISEEKLTLVSELREEFAQSIDNDLHLPTALATLYKVLKSNIPSEDKIDLAYDFDSIFGFELEREEDPIPQEVVELAKKRELARVEKDFKQADELRGTIQSKGYDVKDTPSGYYIRPSRRKSA